jgi:hypothetical protein
MKLTLRDETIELSTPYGKLQIPVSDIRRIEIGFRIDADLARKIESAISELGSPQFKQRQSAGNDLLALKEKAYPALVQATKHSDAEIARRAEEIIAKIRETVPETQLDVPMHDVIYTDDSKITGRLTATSFKVYTFQFGEQQLKLADVRSIRPPGPAAREVADGGPDPGNLTGFQNQIGKTFAFRVTGGIQGSLWGTDVYTTDSTLALAAVHAGLLKPGQTGVVRVTILPSPPAFQGTTRNGVTSSPYGPFPAAYRVMK